MIKAPGSDYQPILWLCRKCGAAVADVTGHDYGHVKHDAEHDRKDDDGDAG